MHCRDSIFYPEWGGTESCVTELFGMNLDKYHCISLQNLLRKNAFHKEVCDRLIVPAAASRAKSGVVETLGV